jgi:hypothetical protein
MQNLQQVLSLEVCLDFHEEIVVRTFPRLIEIWAKKDFEETKLNLSVYNNSKMKRVPLTENELNGATV